jgi:threonine dehydratase
MSPSPVGGAEDDLVTLAAIQQAAETIAGVVRRTPSTFSDSLAARAGRPLFIKREFTQRTGSFKIRGAYNRLSKFPVGHRFVAASAGNHAQGVALAARLLGQQATIFMPTSASLPKLAATRSYGATVVQQGANTDEAIVAAREFSAETGATFVSPFDHPDIIAGQGTIGLEILDQVPELSAASGTVVVAIGGGGLCAGIAAAVKRTDPSVRVVGVNALGAPAMAESIAAGSVRSVPPSTIADGIAIGAPSELTLAHVRAFVDEVVLVSDEEIAQAVLLFVERAKAVVEPAGAAALAAVMSGRVSCDGPVAVVAGGGNVDPLLLSKLMDRGLTLSHRYLVMTVTVPDQPGSLAALTQRLAELRVNVLEVVHQRAGRTLGFGDVSIEVTVETRNLEHQVEVVASLRSAGFGVVSELDS